MRHADVAVEDQRRGAAGEARHSDAVAERVVAEAQDHRLRSNGQRRGEEVLIVPLARQEHHAVLAEGDRLAVAVGGDVMDAVNRHSARAPALQGLP
jgi:hypothetical protein